MHYHKPLMDALRDTLGIGCSGKLNFYKYSTQRECFIGFDQAYAASELDELEFFALLKQAAESNQYSLADQFLGYFLQFKVVKVMHRRNRFTPSSIVAKPHYRVALDTTKNATTGLSQHELLFNLSKNAGALVYYACPMLFDRSDLYEIHIDLDSLRLADLDSCPSAYGDNDNHFIFYDGVAAQPVWCSEPVDGQAVTPREFFSETFRQRVTPQRAAETSDELLNILTNFKLAGVREDSPVIRFGKERSILPLLSKILTVVHVSLNTDS